MTDIIFHIGTPKTGTTAIQAAITENADALQTVDTVYLETGRHRAAHNDLANNIRRKGADHDFKDTLNAEVASVTANRPKGRILLSSEIFSLIDAKKIKDSLPFLSEHPLKIIVYLRRQDRYAEAFYKQRIKNGRSIMPFEQFLVSRLGRKITDYNSMLGNWADAFSDAKITPRLYERDRFVDGNILADFATLLGVDPTQFVVSESERNISPSKDVIDILLATSPHLDGRQIRSVYRALKPLQLEGFSASGDLLSNQARIEYLDRFSEPNEQLRKLYFPKEKQLFCVDDASQDEKITAGLTTAQQGILNEVLKEALRQHGKSSI